MSEQTVFVARERELIQLNGFLRRALAGEGQVCFVTGEAGSGKTALVMEFTRRCQKECPDLVFAFGQCNAHSGIGDPYLPFREILQQLTGDEGEGLARDTVAKENASRLRKLLSLSGRALVEVGPDLIGLFLPPAGLVARLASFAFDESEWGRRLQHLTDRQREQRALATSTIDQGHVFEQYTNVLRRLAEDAPLMLFLDDLHWTDTATAALLFHLARRIEESRILLLGTFRPDEIAEGRAGERHPMEKVLAECKRYHGEICIELGETDETERRRFVDAFLDTEPNHLDEAFRERLCDLTAGHPLFTIELLRDMQERGDLAKGADGYWAEGPVIDWDDLPERVEGVIAERIGRLPEELREVLMVGSVEGETFTAEAVARVQETTPRRLLRRLGDELERQQRLVQGQGVRHLDGQRLSLFRFIHSLFRVYLYNELTEAERVFLHEDVGNALEALYGDHAGELAVQLALHFEIAGLKEKARLYMRLAGEQAAARFANTEAVSYFTGALRLVPPGALDERYPLLLAREKVHDLQGDREAQRMDLKLLREIVDLFADDWRQIEVALRRANYANATSAFAVACDESQLAVELARRIENRRSEARGHLEWGRALIPLGEYDLARNHLSRALELAELADEPYVQAESLRLLGTASFDQGDYEQAQGYYDQSLDIWRQLGDQKGEAAVLHNLGSVQFRQGNNAESIEHFRRSLTIRQRIGDRPGQAKALTNLGILAGTLGDWFEETAYLEQALRIYRETEDRRGETAALNNLGASCYYLSDYEKAKEYFEQALTIRQEVDDPRGEAEVLNNLCAVCESRGDYNAAERYAAQALPISREVGDRQVEGVVLINLGNCQWAKGGFMAAWGYYEEALRIFQELGQPLEQASALRCLGRLDDCLGDFAKARIYLDQALRLSDQAGGLHKEDILIKLGLLSLHCGDYSSALEYGLQALTICQDRGTRLEEGQAWMLRGDCLVAMGRVTESFEAYQTALGISRELNLHNLATEPLAGLAGAALLQGDLVQAKTHVMEILRHLETRTLDGTNEPFRVYLTCYRVLRQARDSRAEQLLDAAYSLLQERATGVDDDELRQAFLENVRVNREIIQEWQAQKGG